MDSVLFLTLIFYIGLFVLLCISFFMWLLATLISDLAETIGEIAKVIAQGFSWMAWGIIWLSILPFVAVVWVIRIYSRPFSDHRFLRVADLRDRFR